MAQKHDTPEYVDAPMTRAGTLELAASRRQIRSDAFTAARWAAVNPILQLGEIGYETDTNKLKVGDGVTEWNDLGYVGGSDDHNKGYFATLAELQEAYPTGEAGDWAIVAESDTVYIWDDAQQAWVDTDQKGQVTSVNNQTGDVTLTASDVGALPTSGGTVTGDITLGSSADIVPTGSANSIGTAQHPFSTIYVRVLASDSQYGRFMIPAADQSTFGFFIALVDPMPTARQDLEAMIFQYMGATDSNYTHGYFYECVTDDNTTWYWKQLDVQPAPEAIKVNTTATLAAADWSSNTQTVTVSGVKADSVVFVSPDPTSASDYASAGILCTSQSADSLTFSCTTTPTNAITVNVVCM